MALADTRRNFAPDRRRNHGPLLSSKVPRVSAKIHFGVATRESERAGIPNGSWQVIFSAITTSAIHESGHFYFAQTGHSHFAATFSDIQR
jgi:hypothetical protein